MTRRARTAALAALLGGLIVLLAVLVRTDGEDRAVPPDRVEGVEGGSVPSPESPAPSPASSPVAVRVEVGDDLAALVAANPPGTTYVFAAGVHREQSVIARDGDTFRGEPGAVLSGARDLTGAAWVADGGRWYVDGQTQEGLVHGELHRDGNPRHRHPEELFVEGRRFDHVGSVDEVGPGRWYLDHAADRLWLGQDPDELELIETSTTVGAFGGSGVVGVTIEDLIIERYATPAQHGAIGFEGHHETHDWTVRRVTVRDNHGAGIRLGPGMTVEDSRVVGNGQLGLGGDGLHRGDGEGNGYAAPVVIRRTEIAGNGVLDFSPFWERGGIKIKNAVAGSRFEENWVHDNRGMGAWWDVDDVDALVVGNLVERNDVGIEYEISFGDTLIADNLLLDNGLEPPWGLPYGAAIVLADSTGVTVRGNVVRGATTGILLVAADRGDSDRLGLPRRLTDVTVEDNHISGVEVGVMLLGSGEAPQRLRVDGNQYAGADAGTPVFAIGGDRLGFEDWQGRGFDRSGHVGGRTPDDPVAAATIRQRAYGPSGGDA